MSPRHAAPRPVRTRPGSRTVGIALIALAGIAVTALTLTGASQAAASTAPISPKVTSLNVHSGGTWGYDLVTVKGSGFGGTGSSRVTKVMFGSHRADGWWVVNSTTLQAYSPSVRNVRTVTDVRVSLSNGKTSPRTSADRFTFVVPTMNTRLNGGWSAAKSRSVANSMIGRAARVNAQPVAHNPGYWTPAMGRSAVHRAANWLGMPYTWAGGNASGPTYGSCYGDGLIGKFDCKFRGFDCSGLTLYAWAKYKPLVHYTESQRWHAGSFHPTTAELQPGDLMFWSEGSSTSSHVTMYAGGGKVIQSSMSGYPVRYSTFDYVRAGHSRYLGAVRPTSHGKQGSSPTISSISVTHSPTGGGATATIHGTHLDTASKVYIGAVGTYSFSIKSSSTITVKLPAQTKGLHYVHVYNAWGESPLNKRVTVTYVAKPTLTAFTAYSGSTAGGNTVTLSGANFVTGAKVYFGSTASRSVRVLSSTRLTALVPAHAPGVVAVKIVTAYGTSNTRGYTYRAPAPPSTTPPPSPSPTSSTPSTPASPSSTTTSATASASDTSTQGA